MRYFPSRRDGWFSLIAWALCPGFLALFLTFQVKWPVPWYLFILNNVLPLGALWAFILWIWFTTGYTITETHLIIKSAFLHWRYPLSEIKRVRPTRNPLSAPALSLSRLEIQFRSWRSSILVSPQDQEGFLRLLRERCPEAEIREGTH